MPRTMAKSFFNVPLAPFSGDPVTFDYFREQVTNLIQINKLSNQEALTLIKGKLEGVALRYYAESPSLKKIADPQQLLAQLENFFQKPSMSCNINTFNNISLQPAETFKNLAHRISVIAAQVYDQLDEQALDQIKFVKLLSCLTPECKYKILQSKVTNFQDAVHEAQLFQDTFNQINVLNTIEAQKQNDFSQEVAALKEQINFLKSKIESRENTPSTSKIMESEQNQPEEQKKYQGSHKLSKNNNHRFPKFNSRNNRVHNNRSHNFQRFRTYSRQHHQTPLKCHFCYKNGHIMKDCRLFLQQMQIFNPQSTWQRFSQNGSASQQTNRIQHVNTAPPDIQPPAALPSTSQYQYNYSGHPNGI